MQPKSLKKKNTKAVSLKERLKPISLEEPLEGSPFLALVQNEETSQDAESQNASRSHSSSKQIGELIKDEVAPQNRTTKLAFESEAKQGTARNSSERQDQVSSRKTDLIQAREPEPLHEKAAAVDYGVGKVPKRTQNGLTARKLCKLLEVDSIDEVFTVSDVLRASSLKLYSTLVSLSDKNGKLKIKAHELMRESGIKGIATFYKQERWLIDLGLIEKRTKPGPHEGSSYRVYSLDSLPLDHDIFEEFEAHLAANADL